MPKYFNLWELDYNKMPPDPKERAAIVKKLMEITKKFSQDHPGSDWGQFLGENKGYASGSESWKDLAIIHQALMPYVRFYEVHQVVSMEESEEIFNTMMAMMQKQ
jgi:hypothetical protein